MLSSRQTEQGNNLAAAERPLGTPVPFKFPMAWQTGHLELELGNDCRFTLHDPSVLFNGQTRQTRLQEAPPGGKEEACGRSDRSARCARAGAVWRLLHGVPGAEHGPGAPGCLGF